MCPELESKVRFILIVNIYISSCDFPSLLGPYHLYNLPPLEPVHQFQIIIIIISDEMEGDDVSKTPERRFSRRINSRNSQASSESVTNTPVNKNRTKLKKKSKPHNEGKELFLILFLSYGGILGFL